MTVGGTPTRRAELPGAPAAPGRHAPPAPALADAAEGRLPYPVWLGAGALDALAAVVAAPPPAPRRGGGPAGAAGGPPPAAGAGPPHPRAAG